MRCAWRCRNRLPAWRFRVRTNSIFSKAWDVLPVRARKRLLVRAGYHEILAHRAFAYLPANVRVGVEFVARAGIYAD